MKSNKRTGLKVQTLFAAQVICLFEWTGEISMSLSRRREILRLAGGGLTGGIAGCVRLTFTDDGADPPAGECEVDAPTAEGVHDVGDGGWPMPGYDPANTYYAPDRTISDLGELGVEWSFQAERGQAKLTDDTVVISTQKAGLSFLDSETGEPVGHLEDETIDHQRTTCLDGTVYFCRPDFDAEETVLVSFDPEAEVEQWEATVNSVPTRWLVATHDEVLLATRDETVYSFDPEDGTERWNTQVGDVVYDRPAIARNEVYVLTDSRELLALDRTTGGKCWGVNLAHDPFEVSVYDGSVYVRMGTHTQDHFGELWAFDGTDGSKRWKTESLGGGRPTEYVSNVSLTEELVVLSGRDGVYGLDHDGSVVWEQPIEEDPLDTISLVVVDDLVLTAGRKSIRGFDLTTGKSRGTFEIGDGNVTTLMAAGETLFVADPIGELQVDGKPASLIVALR